jgi:hypothetical protein
MPDFDYFDLLDKVLVQLRIFREDKLESRRIGNALLLLNLYGAIGETRSYMKARRRGAKRDDRCEREIARIWKVASAPWARIDREFAERCVINGGCWMEPNAWGDVEVRNMEKTIDQVFEETRRLLVEWPVLPSDHERFLPLHSAISD